MNIRLVLDAIRTADTTSQAELVRKTKLSVGTIVRIVRLLKDRDLVTEVGLGRSRVGRRPVQLRFNKSHSYVIAADYAPDETTVAILDLSGAHIHGTRFLFKEPPTPEQFVHELKKHAWELLRTHRIPQKRIAGIGVSTHGSADYKTGMLRYSRHLGWRDVPMGKMISDAMKKPVIVESHARTMTLAEQRWGAGIGAEHLLLIEIDAGIGVTIISDGRIMRGRNGMAGELGQNTVRGVNSDLPRPLYLEDVASGKAMIDEARLKTRGRSGSTLRHQIEGQSLRLALRGLYDAASDGDEVALEVVRNAADYLGEAVSHLINLYDPDRVILAGSAISEGRGILTAQIREIALRRVFNLSSRNVTIEPASLGGRASLLGAAAMVYDDLFSVDGPLLQEA